MNISDINKDSKLLIVFLAAISILLLALALQRNIGTYGVETDFYGGFIKEAKRILNGETLKISFQPPLYPAILAIVKSVTGNWFLSGLLISIVSAVFALFATYYLFLSLYGRTAALGAILFLAAWPNFLVHAISASSDIIFFTFMMVSMALAVYAKSGEFKYPLLAGVLAGLAALTRTNGVILITVAVLCSANQPKGNRLNAFMIALTGFLLPWMIWFIIALKSDSPLFPSQNYLDIAVNFFGPAGHRQSSNSDNWAWAKENFSSLADVIVYDIWGLIRGTLSHAAVYWARLFRFVHSPISVPAIFVGFVGFVSILLQRPTVTRINFLSINLLMYGIICLRSFQTRYFLFLVPLCGAGLALTIEKITNKYIKHYINYKSTSSILFIVLLFPFLLYSVYSIRTLYLREPTEVLNASAFLKEIATSKDHIISRKPHISHYSGLKFIVFPAVKSSEELYSNLCSIKQENKLYLFFSSLEAKYRPDLRFLINAANAPKWLIPIKSENQQDKPWVIYKLQCSAVFH